jgi:hypothetical protein
MQNICRSIARSQMVDPDRPVVVERVIADVKGDEWNDGPAIVPILGEMPIVRRG